MTMCFEKNREESYDSQVQSSNFIRPSFPFGGRMRELCGGKLDSLPIVIQTPLISFIVTSNMVDSLVTFISMVLPHIFSPALTSPGPLFLSFITNSNLKLRDCKGTGLVALGPETFLKFLPLNVEAQDQSMAFPYPDTVRVLKLKSAKEFSSTLLKMMMADLCRAQLFDLAVLLLPGLGIKEVDLVFVAIVPA
nr:hypothetical protein [Tanacetum cinerariifolium]